MESLITFLDATMKKTAPFMKDVVLRNKMQNGNIWTNEFEEMLQVFYTDAGIENAVKGYVQFVMDTLRLQNKFEKDGIYIYKKYDDAVAEVYHNKDYMLSQYLPGLMLSHYLWPHHYRQSHYFREKFLPLVALSDEKHMYDVGVGTGFYSRISLTDIPQLRINAFDISDASIEFSRRHVNAFGVSERWSINKLNILENKIMEKFPFLISVEVLEHLDDPISFLSALRGMLQKNGVAFITAALTAPHADHIFLYRDCREVIDQLTQAGFTLIEFKEEYAYQPKVGVFVPRVASFIVKNL